MGSFLVETLAACFFLAIFGMSWCFIFSEDLGGRVGDSSTIAIWDITD